MHLRRRRCAQAGGNCPRPAMRRCAARWSTKPATSLPPAWRTATRAARCMRASTRVAHCWPMAMQRRRSRRPRSPKPGCSAGMPTAKPHRHIAAAPPLGLDTTDPSGRAAAAWPAGRRGLCRWRQIEHTPVNAASWLLPGELEEDRPAWKELGQSAYAAAAALGPPSGRHPARTTRLGAAPTPR